MKTALLDQHDGLRTFVVVFETGDEAMGGLTSFAKAQGLSGSHFTAIGAFSRATVAYFDWSSKEYRHVPIGEQVEVLSFAGDITIEENTPKVHAHVVLGKADATAHGGHLIDGYVRPTLELVITETPRHLHRRIDASSGLALIDPNAGRQPQA
jgi:predicted DNA-binding protein with PD1-like motif